MMGFNSRGSARLLESVDVPVHVQADEAPWVERSTGVGCRTSWSTTTAGTW